MKLSLGPPASDAQLLTPLPISLSQISGSFLNLNVLKIEIYFHQIIHLNISTQSSVCRADDDLVGPIVGQISIGAAQIQHILGNIKITFYLHRTGWQHNINQQWCALFRCPQYFKLQLNIAIYFARDAIVNEAFVDENLFEFHPLGNPT